MIKILIQGVIMISFCSVKEPKSVVEKVIFTTKFIQKVYYNCKRHTFIIKLVQELLHCGTRKIIILNILYIILFSVQVEKLWQDILTSIQSRHGKPYSSELLAAMSPLLVGEGIKGL